MTKDELIIIVEHYVPNKKDRDSILSAVWDYSEAIIPYKHNVTSSLPDDKELEDWFFMKIGNRETLTEKEYLIGMIMAKHVRDIWQLSGKSPTTK